jgi:hypothetical protein
MTQARLNHQFAARTGESLAVIRRVGFNLVTESRNEPRPEDICLVVPRPGNQHGDHKTPVGSRGRAAGRT